MHASFSCYLCVQLNMVETGHYKFYGNFDELGKQISTFPNDLNALKMLSLV